MDDDADLFGLHLPMLGFGWKSDRRFWLDSLNLQLGLGSSVLGDYAICISASGAGKFWLRDREN